MNKVYVVLSHSDAGHSVQVLGRRKDARQVAEEIKEAGISVEVFETSVVRNTRVAKEEAKEEVNE